MSKNPVSPRMKSIRRWAITTIIVSLSLTALIGIVAVLSGTIDETVGRILGTTLAVGFTAVLVLGCLSQLGRRFQLVGLAGIALSLLSLLCCLVLIWGSFDFSSSEVLWKTFGVSLVLGFSLAQASLLLLLAGRRSRALRLGLWATLASIAVLALLIVLIILSDGEVYTDGYLRALVTFAILDALGTIVVPIVSIFLPEPAVVPAENASRVDERYTHGHHASVLKSHTWRTVENSAAYLIPSLSEGLDVLDVGCGPGTITIDLARRVAPGRVLGLDAAAEVIEKATALAQSEGVSNVEFVVGDAYITGLDSDSFDIVHTHQTLQHVADPVSVLRELRRVVKPSGVVAARDVDYAGVVIYPLSPGLERWAELYQQVHRSNGGEPDAGRRLKAWAREAGFARVEASASIWCFSDDVDREWWGSMWQARVLKSAFAGDALRHGFATQEQLQQISDAWRVWADDPDGVILLPHGEVLCRD